MREKSCPESYHLVGIEVTARIAPEMLTHSLPHVWQMGLPTDENHVAEL